jgi:single-strand DNA-binding protein
MTAARTEPGPANEVRLCGRVAAAPQERVLPSGDPLVTFRLVVARAERAGVDTIDCVAWSARVRRVAVRWGPGDVVAVDGALRRRFWRGGQGPRSRYEVEVGAARRLARAG